MWRADLHVRASRRRPTTPPRGRSTTPTTHADSRTRTAATAVKTRYTHIRARSGVTFIRADHVPGDKCIASIVDHYINVSRISYIEHFCRTSSTYLCGDGGEPEEEERPVHVRVEVVGLQVGLAALLEGGPERVLLPIRTHEPVAHARIHHLVA